MNWCQIEQQSNEMCQCYDWGSCFRAAGHRPDELGVGTTYLEMPFRLRLSQSFLKSLYLNLSFALQGI